ncbi:MAG: diacylglycerol kinase [Pseudomonadales bacterium]|jgi:diacylglycerol kinase (ATP)|nr:diacylglycerol kinase [Pseudomonadales bacterium]
MAKPGERGLRRICSAMGYSLQGLRSCWRNEAAFRQELLAAVVLLPLGLYLGESGAQKALLVGALMLVLIVEVLNSSIEAVVDRIGHEYHDLSGLAKDLGSAAVMLSLLNVALVWGLVLLF